MDSVALQENIGRIDGVETARVDGTNGHIDEVYVLARLIKVPKRSPKQQLTLSAAGATKTPQLPSAR